MMGELNVLSAGDIDTINFMNIRLPWSASVAVHNQDGRIELFAIGQDGALVHRWQSAHNGPFADWSKLD